MSNLFVRNSSVHSTTSKFVRLWHSKPKRWTPPKVVEYITPHDVFRTRLGLPPRLNQTKELHDHMEYSFNDGRTTPLRPAQLKEVKKQQSLAASAVLHLKEIQFIVNRFNQKKSIAENERRQIIESKLKPKGDMLVKKTT